MYSSRVFGQSQMTLLNSIIALNPGGPNCSGDIVDSGHNISDSGCFTHPTSRTNIDPRLGPLGNHGGPTPSLPLLVNSPAIDAALDASAPAIDQRGVSRPQGAHADIGAFEARPDELRSHLSIFRASANNVAIHLLGRTTKPYSLEASSTLSTWTSITTNTTDVNGRTIFTQPRSEPKQFFRARGHISDMCQRDRPEKHQRSLRGCIIHRCKVGELGLCQRRCLLKQTFSD